MRNDSDDWMILIGEESLAPRHYRIYEFLHGYEDRPVEELEEMKKDPLYQILQSEIQKEIDAEIIHQICATAREGGDTR